MANPKLTLTATQAAVEGGVNGAGHSAWANDKAVCPPYRTRSYRSESAKWSGNILSLPDI